MIRLQKTILTVGIFSIFEANLQDSLGYNNGFAEAKKILKQAGEDAILEQLTDLGLAINVLKHVRGRSYDALIAKGGGTLNSNIMRLDEQFYNEGDVSENATLIDVDDQFIYRCAELIKQVSEVIRKVRPEVVL